MHYTTGWSWVSMLIYCLMGIIGALCIQKTEKKVAIAGVKNSSISISYIVWFVVWELFAVFRLVAPDGSIGGMDAPAYIEYFEECLNPNATHYFIEHVDVLYGAFNKAIRFFTSDYHVCFFFIYGIIILSYITVVKEFKVSALSYIPLCILVYIYIRGFASIRTNFSVAFVLFSVVLLYKKKYWQSILLALMSCMIHVASVVYAGFLLFYYYNQKKHIRVLKIFFWIMVAAGIGSLGQYVIANVDLPFLSRGAYKWYAVYSQEGKTFFDNFWKIAFPQMLLGVTIFIFDKDIRKATVNSSVIDATKMEYIRLVCIYDIVLIPITYILNIWRGYEYLYIFRLLMWAILIPIFLNKFSKSSRFFLKIVILIAFISWMIFRQYNTWEDSGLMPYIFEPLYNLLIFAEVT